MRACELPLSGSDPAGIENGETRGGSSAARSTQRRRAPCFPRRLPEKAYQEHHGRRRLFSERAEKAQPARWLRPRRSAHVRSPCIPQWAWARQPRPAVRSARCEGPTTPDANTGCMVLGTHAWATQCLAASRAPRRTGLGIAAVDIRWDCCSGAPGGGVLPSVLGGRYARSHLIELVCSGTVLVGAMSSK